MLTTTTTQIISCTNPNVSKEEKVKDYTALLLKIQSEAYQRLTTILQDKKWIDVIENLFLRDLFSYVNEIDTEYELQLFAPKHKKISNFFIEIIKRAFEIVNIDLRNKYVNYYMDSLPLDLNLKSMKFKVLYINQKELNKLVNSVDNDNKAVNLIADFSFKTQLNGLVTSNWISNNFFVAEQIDTQKEIFNLSMVNAYKILSENIFNNLNEILIDKSKDFAKLYDNFQINYRDSYDEVEELIKSYIVTKIASVPILKGLNITFNTVNNLLSKKSTAFENVRENHNKERDDMKSGIRGWLPHSIHDLFRDIGSLKATEQSFAKYYSKKILPDFKLTSSSNLILGTFKLNLTYFNIHGLTFCCEALIKIKELYNTKIIISITAEALNKRIINFGKLIIEFFKFYDIWSMQLYNHYGQLRIHQHLPKEFINFEKLEHTEFYNLLISNFQKYASEKKIPDYHIFNMMVINVNSRKEVTKFVLKDPKHGGSYVSFRHYGNYGGVFSFGLNKKTSLLYFPMVADESDPLDLNSYSHYNSWHYVIMPEL